MKNLKILRNQAKITQIDAAKIFNMSLRGYQDIENGVNETSYTNLVMELAKGIEPSTC